MLGRGLKMGQAGSVVEILMDTPLFQRLFLSLISVVKPKRPPSITVETFNVCNLKCKMCPYELMTRKKEKMAMELFTEIVDQAVQAGINELQLSNFNEPLLDDLLFERVRYAKDNNMRVRFVSNGTLLTEDKIAQILDTGVDSITFSFDGATRETYEKIRVGADFDAVTRNILSLIEERNRRGLEKPRISMNFVVQEDNFHEVPQFRNMWKDAADHVSFVPANSLRGDRPAPGGLDTTRSRTYPCVNLWYDLVVLSSGKVALCCQDYDGAVIVGDLTRQTIEEVWSSRTFTRIRELHLAGKGGAIKICRNCNLLFTSRYYWFTQAFQFLRRPLRKLHYRQLVGKLGRGQLL